MTRRPEARDFNRRTLQIVGVLTLVGLYTLLQCLNLLLYGVAEGSSWLHLAGFALGLIPAVVLLKRGMVAWFRLAVPEPPKEKEKGKDRKETDDKDAKGQVEELVRSFGHEDVMDLGDISTARGPEMMLPAWVRVMAVAGSPKIGFKVVR